ncbi:MAG: purine-nucleoside phosphorylase [Bryobacterales bacterium]|nr:purine-nucleoside phosphorylase [Bryobacterales bacterium]
MIREAKEWLDRRTHLRPRLAVVLGSGLQAFARELEDRVEIPYGEIPHWPCSTVEGHAGVLAVGGLGGLQVAALCGRAHLYEGYTPAEVVFGVRVMGLWGVRGMVFTNAAGGINLSYARGALVLIADHLNLQGSNPLAGPGGEGLGPRFPDMSEAYPLRYREIARQVAAEEGIAVSEGVYAAMLGPSFETPAEIRYLRAIGADLVGMSTVPEVIAANQMGIRVLGISCVTNMAAGILPQKLSHQEVLETGEMVRGTLVRYLKALLPRLEV